MGGDMRTVFTPQLRSMTMNIVASDTQQMLEIVAGLVTRGLTFEAAALNNGTWNIELTGGF